MRLAQAESPEQMPVVDDKAILLAISQAASSATFTPVVAAMVTVGASSPLARFLPFSADVCEGACGPAGCETLLPGVQCLPGRGANLDSHLGTFTL